MPGDPLRAKFIADTFLTDVRQVNGVRGMLGFTGKYNGKEISVMGSGMGMPSIGIYSYELFTQYDVDRIIRIGSAGSYSKDLKVYDVVLVTGAVSESSYAYVQSGYDKDETLPSENLNNRLRKAANDLGIEIREGKTHSSDVFYRQPSDASPTYWEKLRDEKRMSVCRDGKFCIIPQRKRCRKRGGVSSYNLRQFCGGCDNNSRGTSELLHKYDEDSA